MTDRAQETKTQFGQLAKIFGGQELPLEILPSRPGYYLGTQCDGEPYSRESREYYKTRREAEAALKSGQWTQRPSP